MRIIIYECPRPDCQKVQSFQTDSNCHQFICQSCGSELEGKDVIGVEKIDNS